jgi:serine/threonine-protein kinase
VTLSDSVLALPGRYAIERELGRGGMATVYLAQDLRHDRPVAIKVLREELAAAIGAERFAREIRLLARLRHPFILPLHDSGEADGQLYYVMPYIDGESLAARLGRTGRLAVGDAVEITREIADALNYAHGEGVVHRDVKPENILLTRQGHALLADFGIARGGMTAADGDDRLTRVGVAVGTPTYMSPEQISAEEVTSASDIYSLGATFFEMVAGRPPFVSDTPTSRLALQHLVAPVPTLASVGAMVSPTIEAAVRQALAKEPAERFASASAFAAALATGGVATTTLSLERPVAPQPESLVVLPLANISGDQESEYLSEGLTDQLIGTLARIGGLRVISRTSAFAFKGKNLPLREIGRQLNVGYALEGAVRRAGERLRISAQLVRISDDSPVWSETYERRMTDMFEVQDDIARRITSTLTRTLKLTPVPTPAPAAVPRNLEAYNKYLLGRYQWNKRTPSGLQEARALFEQAIDADPGFAPAYSGLADATALMVSSWLATTELYQTSIAAAERAVALDPLLAEGHASLGFVRLHAQWDWTGAEAELRQAIALNPSYISARQWLSTFLSSTGRFNEALPLAEGAVQLDPLSILARVNLGNVYVFADQYAEAERHYRQAVAMEPGFESAQTWLAIALAAQGKEEAESVARVAIGLNASDPAAEGVLSFIYALLGRTTEAEEVQQRFLGLMTDTPLFAAFISAALGREEATFVWLERAYDKREQWMYSIQGQPAFRRYRNHPRFRELVKRMGLPEALGNGG